jgi:acyl dehydratase
VTDLAIELNSPPATGEGRVDPDAAIAFALATDEPNEVCRSGAAVPPMYSCTLIRRLGGRAWGGPDGSIRGGSAIVHGEHDVTFHRPIEAGEPLSYTGTAHSLRQSPAGVLATQRIAVVGSNGGLVAEHLWTTLYVGARAESDAGPGVRSHSFPEDARSHPLGEHEFPIAIDQAFRFAGVSGDHNRHAIDGQAARAEGFPDRILQGVCTMSMCAGAVVRVAADGEPSRLARFACRLAAPVFARTVLRVEVYQATRSPDGSMVIAFEASAGGRTVVKHGYAEIRPSPAG